MGKSLFDVLQEVAADPAEQSALQEVGATGYLARHGFGEVDPEDLREAVALVTDTVTLPPEVTQALSFSSEAAPGDAGPSIGLAESGGNLAAFGDVSEDVDGEQEASAAGAGSKDVGQTHSDLRKAGGEQEEYGPDATVAFGSGANTAAQDSDDVTASVPRDDAHGSLGDEEGLHVADVAAPDEGFVDTAEPVDEGVDIDGSVDETDPFTVDFGENAANELPDDPADLDNVDVGSF